MQPGTPWKPDWSDLLPNRCFLVRFEPVHLLDQLHVQLPWQLPMLLHVSHPQNVAILSCTETLHVEAHEKAKDSCGANSMRLLKQ